MNWLLSTRSEAPSRVSGWTLSVGVLGAALILLVAIYWPTVTSLISVWAHDGTYQYAFLIFPLSAWIAFGLRHRLAAAPPRPSVWGLVSIAALVFVWYVGHQLDINLAQHFALVALFPALVLSFWGWLALRILVFPLGYLLFAIPWGDALVGPLQDITAHIAVGALQLTGTPALLNGREIISPAAVWMVADACSGVKFFIACIALGCLYAYLMYRRWRKRIVFVALAAVVPVIANGFRVYFTVLIGDTWGMEYATGTDHLIFGWQFFGTVLLLLLVIGWFFRDQPAPNDGLTPSAERLLDRRAVLWLPALALLVAGPVLAGRTMGSSASLENRALAAPLLPGWVAPQPPSGDWHPSFHGANGEYQALYRRAVGNDEVELFHATYVGRPRRGHNLITFGNDVYDPANSRILSTARRRVSLLDERSLTVRELRLAGAGGAQLVWYWYCVNHYCTDWPVLIKLAQAWYVLGGRVLDSSVWAVSSPVSNGNDAKARAELVTFIRAIPRSGASSVQQLRDSLLSGQLP